MQHITSIYMSVMLECICSAGDKWGGMLSRHQLILMMFIGRMMTRGDTYIILIINKGRLTSHDDRSFLIF